MLPVADLRWGGGGGDGGSAGQKIIVNFMRVKGQGGGQRYHALCSFGPFWIPPGDLLFPDDLVAYLQCSHLFPTKYDF